MSIGSFKFARTGLTLSLDSKPLMGNRLSELPWNLALSSTALPRASPRKAVWPAGGAVDSGRWHAQAQSTSLSTAKKPGLSKNALPSGSARFHIFPRVTPDSPGFFRNNAASIALTLPV
ncbi:hypothetical protein H920_03259 [Fukomys damarensis]|uniref:Uncharacterized protein n=1 Tax=Fukomys damarensis TaxID=885580 RepID=A0A091EIR7_FUKDA|nr:hypothetical protein H920_03259 [Fukomys damarensis]